MPCVPNGLGWTLLLFTVEVCFVTTNIYDNLLSLYKCMRCIFLQQHYVPMPWTLGVLERPLGNARLQTVRLLATLLGGDSTAVRDELTRLGTISILLVFRFEQ